MRRPWRVIGVWLALITGCAFAYVQLNQELTSKVELLDEQPSARATNLIARRLAGSEVGTSIFCTGSRDPIDRAAGPQLQSSIVVTEISAVLAEVESCFNSQNAEDPGFAGNTPWQVSFEPELMAQLQLIGTPRETASEAVSALYSILDARQAGNSAGEPERETIHDRLTATAKQDMRRADTIGVLVAVLVLIIVVRALVTSVIPLVVSGAAILAALGVALLFRSVLPMSLYVVNIIVMFGLAVGIDYSLLLIDRYREERRAGNTIHVASARTAETAGKTIAIAGMAAVVSLSGLLLVPISIVRSLALGAIVAILMGMVAALTLVPALVRIFDRYLDWPGGRSRNAISKNRQAGGVWIRLTEHVMRRPLIAVAIALAILAPLMINATAIEPGLTLLPPTLESAESANGDTTLESRALELATKVFSVVEIVVDDRRTPDLEQQIDQLVASLGAAPAFLPVVIVQWNTTNDLAVISSLIGEDPDSSAALQLMRQLRDETIPGVFQPAPANVTLGGAQAAKLDALRIIEQWQWRIAAIVMAMCFLLLLVTFRSIAIPIKATVMNLLSTGASLGALVLVFQEGHGADVLGMQRTESIEAWIPLMLFCVLFGISTDYHLFLLSRVRELYGSSFDNRASVAGGLQATGRIVTGASFVMAAVFASFATGQFVALRQLGLGLAIAVFLDATVVRSMLVPALMAMLGRWNWYLPPWLSWMPSVGFATPVQTNPVARFIDPVPPDK